MGVPKHILAGHDLSPASDYAVEWAANLASALGARLTVVLAHEAPYPYPIPLPPEYSGKLRLELEERCALLRSRVSRVDTVVREGPPWSEILLLSKETDADMIVVGTHGRSGLPRLIMGSVAERLVRLSHIPVITVPSHEEATRDRVVR